MIPVFSRFARVGLAALGLTAGATALAHAGPLGLGSDGRTVAPSSGAAIIQIEDDGSEWLPRRRGPWTEDGDFTDTRPPPPPPRNRWDDDGGPRWRHGDRRFWDPDFDRGRFRRHSRSGFYLEFGDGPPPRHYVQPRRYRVQGLSRDHVEWCRDRYRSYRVFDNSYNPGYGRPRKQCYSPYL